MRGFDIVAEITNARDCHKSALKFGKPGKRRGEVASGDDAVDRTSRALTTTCNQTTISNGGGDLLPDFSGF
jgi:hypothetical protein